MDFRHFVYLVYASIFRLGRCLRDAYNFVESIPSDFVRVRWERARDYFYRRLYLFLVGDIPYLVIVFTVYCSTQLLYAFFQILVYVIVSYFRIMLLWLSFLYNSVNFSLFFISSQFFVLLDLLNLLFRVFVYPVALSLRLLFYRLVLVSVRPHFLVVGLFARTILLFLFSFFLVFIVLYVCFNNSDLFGGFIHYDKGMQRLDFITTNLIGSWYSSNWWYARIWVLYLGLYLFVPSSRQLVRENWYFLVIFPLFLVFYDHRGVSEYFLFNNDQYWVEASGFFSILLVWGGFFRIFLSKYNSSFHSNHAGDVYPSPLDSDPVWTETNFIDDVQFSSAGLPANVVDFGDPDAADIVSRFVRRSQFAKEYSQEGPGSESSIDGYAGRFLHYNMDYGEMYFRATEFSDLVPVRAIYLDESYYKRVLDDVDSGLLFESLSYDYHPPYLYGGRDGASRLYRYRFVGSVANAPELYGKRGHH
jgi:hypothetical protein